MTVKDSEKCEYCEDELEEQNIYNRRIQVVDEFKHVKREHLFCSRNCMINFFETDLKEITDIVRVEAIDEISKKIEVKRQKLIELVKSDRELEKHMSKIKRTPYEVGYADAAGEGRISELHLIEQIQREILGDSNVKETTRIVKTS